VPSYPSQFITFTSTLRYVTSTSKERDLGRLRHRWCDVTTGLACSNKPTARSGMTQSVQRLRYALDVSCRLVTDTGLLRSCSFRTVSEARLIWYPMDTEDFPQEWTDRSVMLPPSLPSCAQVKNAWRHAYTFLHPLRAWCLIKHSDKFTFFLVKQNRERLQ
jgi:hypothetical protein